MPWVPGSAVSVHPMGELWTSVDQQNVVRFQHRSLHPTCGCTQGEGDVSRSGGTTSHRYRKTAPDAGLATSDRAWQTPADLVHACHTGGDGRSDVKSASDSRTVGDAGSPPEPRPDR